MPSLAERVASIAGVMLLVGLIALAGWPPSQKAPATRRTFTRAPTPIERDSLAALAATGTTVRWRGRVQPVALELDRDPVGTVRVAVAAPAGSLVLAADALGTLDSGVATDGGTAFALRGAISPLAVSATGEHLRASIQRSSAKSVALSGPAGWEARFLLATLEGAGLPVTARIRVAPQTWVTQGRPLPLDTARHSVAVVLGPVDAQAASQVRAFVRAGGGVVIAPATSGLDDIAPGRFGAPFRPPGSLSLPNELEQLVKRPITRLAASATPLDITSAGVTTAVHRVGAGRVVQLANEDTWRLVLASDAGRTVHALLWLRAIALARPRDVGRPAAQDDVAPLAALVAALGPASATPMTTPNVPWEEIIALLMFAALVGEWGMRRLGGKP